MNGSVAVPQPPRPSITYRILSSLRHIVVAAAGAVAVIAAANGVGAAGARLSRAHFELPSFEAPASVPHSFPYAAYADNASLKRLLLFLTRVAVKYAAPVIVVLLVIFGLWSTYSMLGGYRSMRSLRGGGGGGGSGGSPNGLFWIFGALAICVGVLMLATAAAFGVQLAWLAGSWFVALSLKHNFTVCLIPVVVYLAPALKDHSALTWKTLKDNWLKEGSTIAVVSAAGFGVLGYAKLAEIKDFVSLDLNLSELPPGALLVCYGIVALLHTIAKMTATKASATHKEDTSEPRSLFTRAFRCAWASNVASWSLVLNGIVLTIYSHFARQ